MKPEYLGLSLRFKGKEKVMYEANEVNKSMKKFCVGKLHKLNKTFMHSKTFLKQILLVR